MSGKMKRVKVADANEKPINRNLCSRRGKHRRLWRLAVATHPTIAEQLSAPCPEGTRIYQKPTASSEGAQLWDKQPPHLLLVPQSGTDYTHRSVPLRVGCSKSAIFSARFLTQ